MTFGLLTPFDRDFEKVKAKIESLQFDHIHPDEKGHPMGALGATISKPKVQAEKLDSTAKAIGTLEDELPYGELLYPSTKSYTRAIFIGNLLYSGLTPAAVVLPRTVEDVAATVNSARTNRIRLTVKGGGHSYAGYCLNHGGIVMDMSAMKEIEISEDSSIIRIQAGCLWRDVYDKLVKKDPSKIIIGGQCPYVGVGGFTLGGGLSPFSRAYGMGIDNVIEFKIVTAQGKIVTVTNHETTKPEQDLFWALCGGGGGNFGVMVEFKSKIRQLREPNGDIVCGQLTWLLPQQEKDYKAMMKEFNETKHPEELCIDAIVRYSKDQLMGQMTVIYNGGKEKYEKAIESLIKYNPTKGAGDPRVMKWKDWMIIEEDYSVKGNVYHHHASFIFGEGDIIPELVEKVLKLLIESHELLRGDEGSSHFLWDHMGRVTADVGAKDTSFYWRNGVYASNFKISWKNSDNTNKMLDFMQRCKEAILPYALDKKAAYLNYIDSTVSNWPDAYYGSNYTRLQEVKKEWDPTCFFDFQQAIKPPGVAEDSPIITPVPIGVITTPQGTQTINWTSRPVPESRGHGAIPSSEPTALERTRENWEKFSLPDPKVIDDLGDADVDQILEAIHAQRMKGLKNEIEAGI